MNAIDSMASKAKERLDAVTGTLEDQLNNSKTDPTQ